MNTIFKKTLVISIILLLVGVTVSSGISVDNKPVIPQDESEDCIDCRELSNAELVKVKQLVKRVEVYSKLLLVLSKDYPVLYSKGEELSYKISNIREKLENEDIDPILCIFSLVLFFITVVILKITDAIISAFPTLPDILLNIYMDIVVGLQNIIIGLIIEFCGPIPR